MMALVVLVTVCVLAGCGSKVQASESDFMVAFSLGSIIEANKQFLSTQEIASGGTVSGPAQPFFQRREEAIVQVESSNIPAFMEAVQSGIERALTDHGFLIVGRGSGRQGPGVSPTDLVEFDLRYSDSQVDGIVNVWGVRGQGTGLILIALITESPKT
jgi:hypothetical protein